MIHIQNKSRFDYLQKKNGEKLYLRILKLYSPVSLSRIFLCETPSKSLAESKLNAAD